MHKVYVSCSFHLSSSKQSCLNHSNPALVHFIPSTTSCRIFHQQYLVMNIWKKVILFSSNLTRNILQTDCHFEPYHDRQNFSMTVSSRGAWRSFVHHLWFKWGISESLVEILVSTGWMPRMTECQEGVKTGFKQQKKMTACLIVKSPE